MPLLATHINYFFVCKRKLWLFSNGINMEHTSDTVYDGKMLHENSYPQRAQKHNEMELSAQYGEAELTGKIDFYDAAAKTIHETKRSDKVETAQRVAGEILHLAAGTERHLRRYRNAGIPETEADQPSAIYRNRSTTAASTRP